MDHVRDEGRHRRRGAAAVEMAVLTPIFCAMIVGMFEIGRGAMVKTYLSDAARQGCRTGVKAGKANADITTDVNNVLTDHGIPTGSATITILAGGAATDAFNAVGGIDSVSVKVSIPVSSVNWIGTWFLTGTMIESDTVVMLKQG